MRKALDLDGRVEAADDGNAFVTQAPSGVVGAQDRVAVRSCGTEQRGLAGQRSATGPTVRSAAGAEAPSLSFRRAGQYESAGINVATRFLLSLTASPRRLHAG